MRKYKYLYIFTSIFLCLFSFFKLFNVYAQQKEFTIDSILINNEEVDIKDGCNLNLKYNDVIRITGKNTPKSEVTLSFANQEYTTQTDENGNWMILISIPYIEGGEYKITGSLNKEDSKETLCIVNLESEIKQTDTTNNNKNILIYIALAVFILVILAWLPMFLISRKKRNRKK